MNPIKKTVFSLDIDNYAPEIKAITMPLIKRYCEKIDAELHLITERKFPGWPIVYEKLQIFELGREQKNDWNIFVDADTLIHPDFFDVTAQLDKDTVAHNGKDPAMIRWSMDEYFLRDGRNLGSCNWFACASDWCLDLWRPLDDLTLEEAVSRIHPVVGEINSGIVQPEHLIDDYTLSRNIARFGLKFLTLMEMCSRYGYDKGNPYLFHVYSVPNDEKVIKMRQVLKTWNVT